MPAGIHVPGNLHPPSADEVREHLEAVAKSPGFASAPRKAQLLQYLVARALADQATNEYTVAVDVFGKPSSFNPSEDSIVRTEATRLRQKLKQYYLSEGRSDRIRIELPLRSYTPAFVTPTAASASTVSRPKRAWIFWTGFAATAVIAAAGMFAWNRSHAGLDTRSVAILPFLNLSGDSSQEFVSESITDELTEALAETSGMRVVARTSAFQFKGKEQDVREIGRRLNVGAILEGSVKRTRGKLELLVQLVSTANGYRVWSKTFNVPDRDLRQAETDIAEATRAALLPGKAESPREVPSTGNPQAHNLYLQAVYLFYKADPESLRKCLDLARQAVKLDPSFLRAHLLIVKAEANLAALGMQSPRDADDRSAGSLAAVLALNPGSPEAHNQIAFRAYVRHWDWPKAESEFRTALAGGGSAANAHNFYGWSLMTRGRFAEAQNHFAAALEIDPLVQTGARSNSAIAWIMQRKYAEATGVVNSMIQLNPNSVSAYGLLSWIALAQGDCASARKVEKKLGELVPADPGWVNPVYESRCGSPDQARRRLAETTKADSKRYFAPYNAAEAYSLLGDADRAVAFLNRAAEEKSDMILCLQVDPLLDPIRKDPRMQALAKKIGLPDSPHP